LAARHVNGERRPAQALKTYSRLARGRRMPSEYELVTTDLLYYPGRGFEVTTPLGEWYAAHQTSSPLVVANWECFADPRQTTYAKYAELAHARESYVDGILQSIEDTAYDRTLSVEWRATLDAALGPLRFPLHGFQMIAAYVGQMAPSGRITVTAAFQAADEVRRIQRIAYRMAQLRLVDASFGDGARDAWQRDPAWQPLREAVERCLVTYDWAEALVALNLCLKPAIDELFMVGLARRAKRLGDFQLGQIFASLDEDCRWHREWTISLLEIAIQAHESNRSVIEKWTRKWAPVALRSAEALADFGDGAETVRSLSESSGRLLGRVGVEALPP
jgi:toluene monooxygenase system protein E